MDWHITFYKEASEGKRDLAGQIIGWTGFTWDKHLFPNPKMFLDWCVLCAEHILILCLCIGVLLDN